MNRVVSLFLILLFALSCNNEEEGAINEIDDDIEPAVTATGFPIGRAILRVSFAWLTCLIVFGHSKRRRRKDFAESSKIYGIHNSTSLRNPASLAPSPRG